MPEFITKTQRQQNEFVKRIEKYNSYVDGLKKLETNRKKSHPLYYSSMISFYNKKIARIENLL